MHPEAPQPDDSPGQDPGSFADNPLPVAPHSRIVPKGQDHRINLDKRGTDRLDGKYGGLTPRQAEFIEHYLSHGNATKAYQQAYGDTVTTYRAAAVGGTRLTSDPRIRQIIDAETDARAKEIQRRTGVTLERTVGVLANLAFFDVRGMFDADGMPIPVADLPEDLAQAIGGIEVRIVPARMDRNGNEISPEARIVRYTLSNRTRAVDMLMQHLNGYKDHRAAAMNPLVDLLRSMRRSALPVVADVTTEPRALPGPNEDDDA